MKDIHDRERFESAYEKKFEQDNGRTMLGPVSDLRDGEAYSNGYGFLNGCWAGWKLRTPATITDETFDVMVLAFHKALSDGAIGEDELFEIRTGLRAAMLATTEAGQP